MKNRPLSVCPVPVWTGVYRQEPVFHQLFYVPRPDDGKLSDNESVLVDIYETMGLFWLIILKIE